jgi:hypothetical protein
MPKGEAIEQFAASMHLALDLADIYPRDSLAAHILDVAAQFLPALLTPCSRRGRARQIVSNTKRFQRGEGKGRFVGNRPCVLHGEKLIPMLSVSITAPSVLHLSRLE